MLEQDLQLVEVAFKKYYFDHFDLLLIPERSSEREFGYQKFNGGMNSIFQLNQMKNSD